MTNIDFNPCHECKMRCCDTCAWSESLLRVEHFKRAYRYQKAATKIAAVLVVWTMRADGYSILLGPGASQKFHKARRICDRLVSKLNHCSQKALAAFTEATI